MNVNEARGIHDDVIPPPAVSPWFLSCNYSRSMHELIIGIIMAVNIYNKTVLEAILSPLFLLYFTFGICELFLKWTDDRNWIWCVCKASGRISHAIGSFILLGIIFRSNDEPAYRFVGILVVAYFLLIILVCVCVICIPTIADNNDVANSTTCPDAELLLDDSDGENISQIRWWESIKLGRIMYELILGANVILIAHYHIPLESYLVFTGAFLYWFAFEFAYKASPAARTVGRTIAQLIGVLTFSFFVYCLISPVFALGLGTISIIWYGVIALISFKKYEKEEAAREAHSEIVVDEEAPPLS